MKDCELPSEIIGGKFTDVSYPLRPGSSELVFKCSDGYLTEDKTRQLDVTCQFTSSGSKFCDADGNCLIDKFCQPGNYVSLRWSK